MDVDGMSLDEIEEASEVFVLPKRSVFDRGRLIESGQKIEDCVPAKVFK